VDTGAGHRAGVTLGDGAGPQEIGGNEPVRLTAQTAREAGATPLVGASAPNVESRTSTTLAPDPPGTLARATRPAASALIVGWEAEAAGKGVTKGEVGVA
jgi:hypothetical protein